MSGPSIIADGHNDLLPELVHRRGERQPFRRHHLDALRDGGVRFQVCPVYLWWDDVPDRAVRSALEQIAAWCRAGEENPDDVVLVRDVADLERAEREDKLGLLLAFEGAEPLGNDPDLLKLYVDLGLRMVGLTHFQRNAFADGNGEPAHGGLSALGRGLVERLEHHHVAIDLAHASDRTFADVLEQTTSAPLLVSHSGCRALHDTPRNVSDDQLRALAARDGVVGIYAIPQFLGTCDPGVEAVAGHVMHAVEVAGPRHVALGGDFMTRLIDCPGLVRMPPWLGIAVEHRGSVVADLAGPQDYPRLVAALRARGLDGEDLAAVLHGNLLRIVRRALPGAVAR